MGVGKRHARKILVASLGVAAVSYVQCGGESGTSGTNKDAGADQVGNLVAPDTGTPDVPEDNTSQLDVVANLVAPDAEDDGMIDLDVVANLVAPDAGD